MTGNAGGWGGDGYCVNGHQMAPGQNFCAQCGGGRAAAQPTGPHAAPMQDQYQGATETVGPDPSAQGSWGGASAQQPQQQGWGAQPQQQAWPQPQQPAEQAWQQPQQARQDPQPQQEAWPGQQAPAQQGWAGQPQPQPQQQAWPGQQAPPQQQGWSGQQPQQQGWPGQQPPQQGWAGQTQQGQYGAPLAPQQRAQSFLRTTNGKIITIVVAVLIIGGIIYAATASSSGGPTPVAAAFLSDFQSLKFAQMCDLIEPANQASCLTSVPQLQSAGFTFHNVSLGSTVTSGSEALVGVTGSVCSDGQCQTSTSAAPVAPGQTFQQAFSEATTSSGSSSDNNIALVELSGKWYVDLPL